jgi:formylglycine-generating enzyme required for sulfatase activity
LEYAARAGTREAWYGKLEDIAWYIGNSEYKPHRVAAKQPNALGLYDVLGNVWERVSDQFEQHYYEKSPARDPKGPSSAEFDLGNGVRGGGYFSAGQNVLLSTREGANVQNSESVGVRCVLETKF